MSIAECLKTCNVGQSDMRDCIIFKIKFTRKMSRFLGHLMQNIPYNFISFKQLKQGGNQIKPSQIKSTTVWGVFHPHDRHRGN